MRVARERRAEPVDVGVRDLDADDVRVVVGHRGAGAHADGGEARCHCGIGDLRVGYDEAGTGLLVVRPVHAEHREVAAGFLEQAEEQLAAVSVPGGGEHPVLVEPDLGDLVAGRVVLRGGGRVAQLDQESRSSERSDL